MQGTKIDPSFIITSVMEIIRKTGKFNSYIDKWDEKPTPQKTWENFKTHFQQAQKKVRLHASTTTTSEAGYANMVNDISTGVANMMSDSDTTPEATHFLQTLSSSVVQNQEQLNQVTDSINNLQHQLQAMNAATSNHQRPSTFQPPPPPYQPPPQQQYQMPPQQQAYCPPVPPQFQQPYMQFQQQPAQKHRSNNGNGRRNNNNMQQQKYQQPYGYGQQQGFIQQQGQAQQNSGRRRQRNPNNGTNHYCWTCGAENHPSAQCKTPAQGHQWGATFRNRFNGNNNGCWN